MAHHKTYNTETGEFDGGFGCSDRVLQRMIDGLDDGVGVWEYASGIDYETKYVDGNTLKDKEHMTCSVSATEITVESGEKATVTISNLPIPCTVEVVGLTKQEISDGVFSASTAIKGIYKIKVWSFGFFAEELEVVIK